MSSIGKAIHDARVVLARPSTPATAGEIQSAIGALLSSGALGQPEGQRLLTQLSALLSGLGRAESLSEWLAEADLLRLRHESERRSLYERAKAVIPDLSESELFPRKARAAAEAPADGGTKAGLPSGLYRHPDGREYRNDAGKPGRRPDWLKLELRVSE